MTALVLVAGIMVRCLQLQCLLCWLLCICCPFNLSRWLTEIQRTQHASATAAMTFMPLQQTTPPCELSMRLKVATVGTVHSSQTTVVENDTKSWERVPEIRSDLVHTKSLPQKQENTLLHTWNVQIHWWLLIAVQFGFQQAEPGQLATNFRHPDTQWMVMKCFSYTIVYCSARQSCMAHCPKMDIYDNLV